jgi:shikimate dehydrogenase
MAGYECLNCDLSLLPPDGLVFDMVSNPADTPLILAAKARGLATVTGLDMLVEQAATSFKLMFGSILRAIATPDFGEGFGHDHALR